MAQASSWAGGAGPSRGGRRRLTPFDVASLWGWDPSVAGCGILEDGPWSQDQATKARAAGVGTALLSLWVLSRPWPVPAGQEVLRTPHRRSARPKNLRL